MPSSIGTGGVNLLDRVALARLKWACRRGMLENDLVLNAFFERHGAEIDAPLAAGLKSLLDLPDGDLWDLIAERSELGADVDAPVRGVLDKLRHLSASNNSFSTLPRSRPFGSPK